MTRLEALFGIDRNRFPKNLLSKKEGTKKLYDYRVVARIMDALLSEEPPKRKTKGSPLRIWLSDLKVRARVLSGIGARIKSLSTPEQIKAEFLAVIDRHLPDSAKK